MEKPAATRYPVHELIQRRWSPVSFAAPGVPADAVGSLLEAARWAPSSFNEQPWSFFVARREEPAAFERLLETLVPANQAWARHAPLLLLSVAKTTFERNGKPNRHAWHDVGLASAQLTLQAEALGLRVHWMAGFDAAKARELLAIPEGHEPVAAAALGWPSAEHRTPEHAARDERPRTRRPLASLAHGALWGSPPTGLDL
jgi:nitroreductase